MPPFLKRSYSDDSETPPATTNKKVREMSTESGASDTATIGSDPADDVPQSDATLIPPGWSFAVVILPRRRTSSLVTTNTGTSRQPFTAEENPLFRPAPSGLTSPQTSNTPRTEILKARPLPQPATRESEASELHSTASGSNPRGASLAPREGSEDLRLKFAQLPELGRLYAWRHKIQKLHKMVQEQGLISVTSDHVKDLKRLLNDLAFFIFPDDKAESWIRESKINVALGLLKSGASFGDDIKDMASQILDRWNQRDFAPSALTVGSDLDLLSDESDVEEADSANTGNLAVASSLSGLAAHLMRGIQRYRNTNGILTMRLLPNADKRQADVFGHNGLQVGDWWPYQLCALRDGAHGSRQGGIFGRISEGCFSIVVSADSEYKDKDTGEELYYSGTISDIPHGDGELPVLTNATKSLVLSLIRRKPVRVIRRGPCELKKAIYPRCGFRYDGLYMVAHRDLVEPRSSERPAYYRFKLIRCPDQPSLESAKSRPTIEEYAAYHRLRGTM